MNLSDPTRAVAPTLDGPVLAVLAAAGRPLTVGEVATQAVRGSEIGIRRSMARLVEQGVVRATLVGRNRVYELNRDHIAAPIAEWMAGLRLELWRRIREELARWELPPLYAAVFGSAARGDGTEASDIDLLLVHVPFPGEQRPRKRTRDAAGILAQTMDARTTAPAVGAGVDAGAEDWHGQVDRIRALVQRWTGNPLQVIDMSFYDWWEPSEDGRRLLAEIGRDGIEVARSDKLPAASTTGIGVG